MDAVNELALPPRDHNQPPLADLLGEETAKLAKRAAALIASGRRAAVSDRETAKSATVLVKMMTDHCKTIEAARVERKQPYLDACRTVDAHFGQLRVELAGPDPKRLGGEAARVQGLIDDFYAAEERRAEAERWRLEEEARRKEEEAETVRRQREEAERQAKEAALAGNVRAALSAAGSRVEAELRESQLQGEARRLNELAQQTRAEPINTGLGVTAHRKSNFKAVITDWNAALQHSRKVNEAAIREVVQDTYNRQVRAGARVLPGANVIEDRRTVIRRA